MEQLMPRAAPHPPYRCLLPFHQGINHLQLLQANMLFKDKCVQALVPQQKESNSSSLRLILITWMFLKAVFYLDLRYGFRSSLIY